MLGAVVAGHHVQGHPLLDPVLPGEEVIHRLGEPVGLGLGEEADVTEVHADQRGARRAGQLGGTQQRPVAAKDDDKLRALGGFRPGRDHGRADALERRDFVLGHPHRDACRGQPLDDLRRAAPGALPAGVRDHQHRPL